MTIRQSFFENVSLNNTWNRVIEWNGLTIGTCQWHNGREWKILKSGTTFDEINDRQYEPLAQFHTQQELWLYIKDNCLAV